MSEKISVLIRNKNEARALDRVLNILIRVYKDEIDEIIVVDNESVDDSEIIAQKYNCKIIKLANFTYGKALNLGIENSRNKYILLLSAHAAPVGANFIKNSLKILNSDHQIAGLRYINSIENYDRFLNNDKIIKDPIKYGIVAACCMVNKDSWERVKFNEELVGGEDKEWSKRVIDHNFKILDVNETYFYFIKRTKQQLFNRYKVELIINDKLNSIEYTLINAFNGLIRSLYIIFKSFLIDLYYSFKRFIFLINYINKRK